MHIKYAKMMEKIKMSWLYRQKIC